MKFIIVALALACSNVSAAIIHFGEDINRTSTFNNENAIRIAHPNADTARANFLAAIQNPMVEDFESYSANSSQSRIAVGNINPARNVMQLADGNLNGAYPISGTNFLFADIGSALVLRLDFNTPQNALGFYATDVEFPGNLIVRPIYLDGSAEDFVVPSKAGTDGANQTGSVIFWGMIDSRAISSVELRRNDVGDGIALDEFVVSTSAIPEPASAQFVGCIALALFFLALNKSTN